ncbi:MAG: aspartyl protease family protein [Chthonomonadetes bacterium]|nr:aspartyl protease family protein [Chthonomonadetes bacterium]
MSKRWSFLCTAVFLWVVGTIPAPAQSPRDLLRNALPQIVGTEREAFRPAVWRAEGRIQVLYPQTNSGSVVLTENGSSFHLQLRVGGIHTESAYDALTGRGWRTQHGAVLPIESAEAMQFARFSVEGLRAILLGGAYGDMGVIDYGSMELPDGRTARWLKVVPHHGQPWDIYLDAEGGLLAWGYHESDSFRRRPTRFIVLPSEWKQVGNLRTPTEVKVYEDDRHTQTVRWEKIERLSQTALRALLRQPAVVRPPAGLPVTLPVQMFQRLALVNARLNGREYTMLLDTGAAITVIDAPVAQALNLPPGESLNVLGASGQGAASVTRLASLELGRVKLRNLQVAVTDLGLIRLVGGERFGGILGFNALSPFRIMLDYHSGTLRLERSGGRLPPGRVIKAQFPGATPLLEMEVEDIGKVPMLLDTGAAMTILPAHLAQQWKPPRSASLGLTLGVGGAGTVPRSARASTVRLAEETITDAVLMFASPAPKGVPVQILSEAGFGLLGNNILRHFRLTIDYPMRRVVLQRMPKPASMGDPASTGIVLDLTAEEAKVAGVTPLSSAWSQGIQRGDEVLAVNGRPTKGVAPAEVQKWLAGEEGSCLRVRLRRGSRVWETVLELKPMF